MHWKQNGRHAPTRCTLSVRNRSSNASQLLKSIARSAAARSSRSCMQAGLSARRSDRESNMSREHRAGLVALLLLAGICVAAAAASQHFPGTRAASWVAAEQQGVASWRRQLRAGAHQVHLLRDPDYAGLPMLVSGRPMDDKISCLCDMNLSVRSVQRTQQRKCTAGFEHRIPVIVCRDAN